MTKRDLCFLKELDDAIKLELYDDFISKYGDEWEIIERLLKIIKSGEIIARREKK